MEGFDITMKDHVAVLTLEHGENLLNPWFLTGFLDALDRIEQNENARTLVVASAHEKIFSNGLDLKWLVPCLQEGRGDEVKAFLYQLNQVFKRLVVFPMPTIAAINGHAFAGGAIILGAFDYRIMRSDRGYLCFPEVDLGIPFLPGMMALMRKSVPSGPVLEDMVLTGRRLTAEEAEKLGIVKTAVPLDRLMEVVLEFARGLDKRRAVVLELKKEMHKEILRIIDQEDPPVIESGRFYV